MLESQHEPMAMQSRRILLLLLLCWPRGFGSRGRRGWRELLRLWSNNAETTSGYFAVSGDVTCHRASKANGQPQAKHGQNQVKQPGCFVLMVKSSMNI
jgi:hypothetical protein